MAGEWLKFEKATSDKPEVFAAATALGIDPDAVVGKLIRVWSWFDTHTVDGNARSVTPALLDRVAGVAGFAIAMANVGWLVISDDGVTLPKFGRHTGETAKGRALSAKRSSTHREKSHGESHAESVTEASPREEEEKRRKETPSQGSGEPLAASGVAKCPQQEIIAAYHEILPELPVVRVWTDANAAELRARWRTSDKTRELDWWRKFFGHVRNSSFLMGKKTEFQASLGWLVKASNFAKVINGNYDDRGQA